VFAALVVNLLLLLLLLCRCPQQTIPQPTQCCCRPGHAQTLCKTGQLVAVQRKWQQQTQHSLLLCLQRWGKLTSQALVLMHY
jgi:hypothetical protein